MEFGTCSECGGSGKARRGSVVGPIDLSFDWTVGTHSMCSGEDYKAASIAKWKVCATFNSREVVLYVNENHLSNVLRTIAGIQFSETGLEQPDGISVTRVYPAKESPAHGE